MVAVFVIIILLCLYNIRFAAKDGFCDYMSPQRSGSVKGVYVLLVIFSHMRRFVVFDRSLFANNIFYVLMDHIGQLMVVMFLFYSGYGIMQAIENKKQLYVRAMPKHRILKTYLHFLAAILIYLIYNLCVGKAIPARKVFLSFLSWESIGNSAWYMFAILVLYIITYAVFMLAKQNLVAGAAAVTALTAVYVAVVWKAKGPSEHWWYDTVICFPLGMWYSLAKPKIDKALLPSFWRWLAASAAAISLFAALHILYKGQQPVNRLAFMLEAPVFALVTVFITMRARVDNSVLRWCGKRVFSIYILQKIPMMILIQIGLGNYPYAFAAVSLVFSFALAEVFDRLTAKADKCLGL